MYSTIATLKYDRGKLIIQDPPEAPPFGEKTDLGYEVSAHRYRDAHSWLESTQQDSRYKIIDEAHEFYNIEFSPPLKSEFALAAFQHEALDRWSSNEHRGIISIPTGSGKSYIAAHAIREVGVNTLFITSPELIDSTFELLSDFLSVDVAFLDSDIRDPPPVVVSSIKKAHDVSSIIGSKFGLVVVDECHRLKSNPSLQKLLSEIIAPHRLGVTSAGEQMIKSNDSFENLLGPVVYSSGLDDLEDVLTTFSNTDLDQLHLRNEIEEQERLIESGHFKPTIIRQSAFFEDVLEEYIISELEKIHGDELSNSQESVVTRLGHQNRIKLAYTIGAIEESEYTALLEMASTRNKLSHNSWQTLNQQEIQPKKIARRTLDILKDMI